MDVKEDAENLVRSVNILLSAMASDEYESKEINEPVYELEEIRQILADKSREGFTEDIRNLLERFGAKKLSEIKPERYADLMQEVEKLVR